MTDDIYGADEIQAERQAEIEEAARQLREQFRQTFLGSQAGAKVLEYLLDYTMFLGSAYTGNAKTYFNEGAQAVGRHILLNLGLSDSATLVRMLAQQGDQ